MKNLGSECKAYVDKTYIKYNNIENCKRLRIYEEGELFRVEKLLKTRRN